MNHFLSMIIYSCVVSACFSLLMKPTPAERWRYFFRLLSYFAGCGYVAAWIMYWLPVR